MTILNKKTMAAALLIFVPILTMTLGAGVASGSNSTFFLYEPDIPAFKESGPGKTGRVPITADAAVLLDAETGQVLYAKNPHEPRPIASTTKIMTALLAIECGDLKGEVTISPRAAGVEGSSIYLRAGEKLSLEELLYGALLHSGNDACVAIAEHVAGREEIFIHWMNYKALKMGLKNTHFSNTNGLPHKEHYSSACDLAVIAMHALKNPVFNRIVATKNHIISGPGGRRHLSNTNQMLWGYKGADGVKTGTTNAAGKCLVASATREGRRLIAVVLHSDNRYADSIRLLDYGFSNFENRTIAKKGEAVTWVSVQDGVKEGVPLGSPRDIVVTVPVNGTADIEKAIQKDRGLRAPVKPGMAAGRLQVLIDGSPVAETELITLAQVDRLPVHGLIFNKIRNGIKQNLPKTS